MNKYAVIVAGGAGIRMGSQTPKQFLLLQGKPVLWHTIQAFRKAFDDIQIILVLPAMYCNDQQMINDIAGEETSDSCKIVAGGPTRFHSVKNGLAECRNDGIVFVHDGVRCLVTPALIKHCYEEAQLHGNAIPALKATDSIRIETAAGNKMVDRASVRLIQTPQTFLTAQLIPAFEQEYDPSFTDEASIAERFGTTINLVDGEACNIKITMPFDMIIAEQYLKQQAQV